MRRSQVVANEVLTNISRPLVSKFLQYSSSLSSSDTEQLITKICELTNNSDPVTWRLVIDQENAPALVRFVDSERSLTVADISHNDALPNTSSIPLLLLRGGMSHLLPSPDMPLKINDEILLCGRRNQTLLAQKLRDNVELVDTLVNNNPHHIPCLLYTSPSPRDRG